jgi:hypothetical protein
LKLEEVGVLEYWSIGILVRGPIKIHYSNIPSFQIIYSGRSILKNFLSDDKVAKFW